MIDISDKIKTLRMARAEARVSMAERTVEAVRKGNVPKGNVLEIARGASVMAAKKTATLIPFCHPIPVDYVNVDYVLEKAGIVITSEVKCTAKTGVEMEALTAVSVAALTVYDMLKPLDKDIIIEKISLLEKKGGKGDFTSKFSKPVTSAVLVISDSTYQGKRQDKSGLIIRNKLKEYSVEITEYKVLPDDKRAIIQELMRLCDEERVDMIFTTGGTGLGPKDLTPEATREVLDRTAPGIVEAIRNYGQQRTPYSMLSRNIAGVRENSLIINLPGSSNGAKESMDSLLPGVFHALKMIRGGGHGSKRKKKKND
jgi:molybdenum cofactor biosynthesis protein MoaC